MFSPFGGMLGDWDFQTQQKFIQACGVVVGMFDFHRSDRGSNPGRGGEFS